MNRMRQVFGAGIEVALAALAIASLAMPMSARAQAPGGAIQKSCTSIKRCAGQCSATPTIPCGTSSLNCPAGETCVLGAVCTTATDCPAGTQAFCVGGPGGGLTTCTPPSTGLCPAAKDCSPCIPIEEAVEGDPMSCEILVTNVSTITPPHTIAISSITDNVFHDPNVGTPFQLFPGVGLFGQCNSGPAITNRCFKDADCPSGTCSLKLNCVDALNATGAAGPVSCPGTTCTSTCPAGQTCSI